VQVLSYSIDALVGIRVRAPTKRTACGRACHPMTSILVPVCAWRQKLASFDLITIDGKLDSRRSGLHCMQQKIEAYSTYLD
jgi:hypothetical protein